MQNKSLGKAGLIVSALSFLLMSAMPGLAANISKTLLEKTGDLYATLDGKEELVQQKVTGAWIIEGGDALVFATFSQSEFSQGYLIRYDPNVSRKADEFKTLMDTPIMVENVRTVKGASGQTGLLVSGTVDGTGGPCVALVDARRGRVWHHMNARITGVRNGRLSVAVYEREGGIDPADKPIRMLYPSIDELLGRTANPSP